MSVRSTLAALVLAASCGGAQAYYCAVPSVPSCAKGAVAAGLRPEVATACAKAVGAYGQEVAAYVSCVSTDSAAKSDAVLSEHDRVLARMGFRAPSP